ncbi:conserved hypothetical protein [Pyrenophora tritici-repentis Pt-1C-BFP]|uniref:Uncharacterized protein n=1 Tax=Pyrenophora tritici-repentis (strain Pt-1C-BFP) TaxID=426418 RepID=B2WJP9_PYRTR|nr:uncharacterized protein PTRG_10395 [Pyrenophora tritici-repentis Pt-1C-BFP]EDU43446.1 conserved hypothetical protein [Pyrenophora tritici-repentis Pt-1C-BFP]
MKEDDGRVVRRSSGHSNEPAIQVICLGSGGGPSEDNVTGFLVRSTATQWAKNSVIAVDAGSHLASITRILAKDFPLVSEPDPPLPSSRNGNANSNGAYDHSESPSPGAAPVSPSDDESEADTPNSERDLPVTITTLKHGLVTFQRLAEGEVSYTNAQSDAVLFGHLAPRHLLEELCALGDMVKERKKETEREKEENRTRKKRKRASNTLQLDGLGEKDRGKRLGVPKGIDSPISSTNQNINNISNDDDVMSDYPTSHGDTGTHTPNPLHSSHHQHTSDPHASHPSAPAALNLSSVSAEHSRAMLSAAFDSPLKGVKVVIIHVKDTFADGPLVGDQILEELREGEATLQEQGRGLGCQFEISVAGGSYWF